MKVFSTTPRDIVSQYSGIDPFPIKRAYPDRLFSLNVLDSIYRGYPIGMLTFCTIDDELYILDGYKRLTVLALCFSQTEKVYFNPVEETFSFYVCEGGATVSLSTILDNHKLHKWFKEYEPPLEPDYFDRVRHLHHQLTKNYSIPVAQIREGKNTSELFLIRMRIQA